MLKLKLQYFGHLMRRADSLDKTFILGKRESLKKGEGDIQRWMVSLLNGHEFELVPGDGEGQGSLVCCRPWGCKELDMI